MRRGNRPPCAHRPVLRFALGLTVRSRLQSESGTTVTITSAANPTNLIVGDKVTIANVSVAGYNGIFTVTAIPSGTTFQYTTAIRDWPPVQAARQRPTRRVRLGRSGRRVDPERRRQGAAGGRRPGHSSLVSRRTCRSSSTRPRRLRTDHRIADHPARIVPAGCDGSVGGHRFIVRPRSGVWRHRREFGLMHQQPRPTW